MVSPHGFPGTANAHAAGGSKSPHDYHDPTERHHRRARHLKSEYKPLRAARAHLRARGPYEGRKNWAQGSYAGPEERHFARRSTERLEADPTQGTFSFSPQGNIVQGGGGMTSHVAAMATSSGYKPFTGHDPRQCGSGVCDSSGPTRPELPNLPRTNPQTSVETPITRDTQPNTVTGTNNAHGETVGGKLPVHPSHTFHAGPNPQVGY